MNPEATENPVNCVAQKRKAKSAPNHSLRVNRMAALAASGLRHGDFPIFTPGADIGVQKDLDIPPHGRTAMVAGLMLELEIPNLPTLWAAVMGDHQHFPGDDVAFRRGVSPGLVGPLPIKPRHARLQQGQASLPVVVKHLDIQDEADGVPGSDGVVQLRQQAPEFLGGLALQQLGGRISDFVRDGIGYLENGLVHGRLLRPALYPEIRKQSVSGENQPADP